MIVFVTGATGLLGSFICRELLEKGYHVRAVKRQHSALTLIGDIADRIDWVIGDMDDTVFLEEALNGVESVIHGAAIISFDKRDEKAMYQTNVQGTTDLVNACLKLGIKKFLHVSSIAAIGRKKGQVFIDENDWWEGTAYDSVYARSKHLSELEVWRGGQEGLEVKIINPSVILGPGLWKKGSTSVFKYAYDEKKYYPSGTINYVDVRDVSKAAILLLESDIHGERFVLNAGAISYREFFTATAKAFGKKPPRKQTSGFLLSIAVFLEFIRSRITGKTALITSDTAKLSQMKFQFKNDKVKEALGFEFIPLEDSVQWTVKELKAMNNL